MCDKDLKILTINEKTALQSIVSDVVTFTLLLGSLWLNYEYLGNSWLVQVFIILSTLLIITGKANRKVQKMSPDEALEFLKSKQEQGQ